MPAGLKSRGKPPFRSGGVGGYRATFNFDNATRETSIPGNTNGKDRFIRADYYRQWLPEPKNTREAIAGILAIARNVSVPFGAPNRAPGSLYNTEYRTAIASPTSTTTSS
jgi:penicillin V acylase-like amidase (Ntn superfamily)